MSFSSCTRSQTALTSDCNSLCPVGRPCVAYAAEDEDKCSSSTATFGNCTSDEYCTYECFATGPNDESIDFTTYTFLIPFGSDMEPSEQEASVKARVDIVTNLTAKYPSKSNDVLQYIEPLDFQTSTTHVVLAGGSSVYGERGQAVLMHLPRELFTADIQLRAITLANLGLTQILESSLPPRLVNLTIFNCLMTSYPDDLHMMSELEYLDLSQNYFEFFPAALKLPNLKTLNLDVAGNNFTSIPAAIFKLENLKRLDLYANQLANVKLTTSQFNFLQELDELNVDSFGKVAECDTVKTLQTSNSLLSVCVTDTILSDMNLSSNKALIAGVIATSIVLFLILALIFGCRYLRRRALSMKPEPGTLSRHRGLLSPVRKSSPYVPLVDEQHYSSDLDVKDHPTQQRLPYGKELEALLLNADDLNYIRKLSSKHRPNRGHRETFLTRFRASRFLVCKRLQQNLVHDTSAVQRFARDIHLAASLDHPRIVALVGIIWSRAYSLEALFEYMDGGDLRSYLAKVKEAEGLYSVWKLQVALDTVEALAYAHSFSPTLVHRGLTSRSVLLSSPPKVHAHLDDFVYDRQDFVSMSAIGLPHEERWLPPEVIASRAYYSPAADIYAFGVILSELDTHSLPYDNVEGNVSSKKSMSNMEILNRVASGKLRPVFTSGCPTDFREFAEQCLSFEASDRPTAFQAVIRLRALLEEGQQTSYRI
ncbi:unnamed protein product [Peronospora belbahrii]|uniref:Protein kinase domain-containing protein n=1 Tax=Peronospora belbahrii TaxID=622444 RepID=A0AAU9L7N0_9STRA|nr:unnamed protein product [Peronospora belbahrii]